LKEYDTRGIIIQAPREERWNIVNGGQLTSNIESLRLKGYPRHYAVSWICYIFKRQILREKFDGVCTLTDMTGYRDSSLVTVM